MEAKNTALPDDDSMNNPSVLSFMAFIGTHNRQSAMHIKPTNT